jgi:hypothetical protein
MHTKYTICPMTYWNPNGDYVNKNIFLFNGPPKYTPIDFLMHVNIPSGNLDLWPKMFVSELRMFNHNDVLKNVAFSSFC